MRYDAIIIGAGHNGLTAAALLTRADRKVLVLERRDIVGGLAAGEEFHPGYRHTGLLHDTTGLRRALIAPLELEQRGLVLTDERPAVFVPGRYDRGLLLDGSADRTADALYAIHVPDARRYREYNSFIERVRPFLSRVFSSPPPQILGVVHGGPFALLGEALALRRLGRRTMMDLLRYLPMCAADFLNEWFESETLKGGMIGPAVAGTFNGPWSPGNATNLLVHACLQDRAVAGGPHALAAALARYVSDQGVEIRLNAEVREIRVSHGCVDGVTLADGASLDAPVVAASCDPRRTLLNLLSNRHVPQTLERDITHYRGRGTAAKLHLALRAPLKFPLRPAEHFEFIRIAGPLDDVERAFDAVKYGSFSPVPVLDIHVPTVRSPECAPPGHEVLSILAHYAPYNLVKERAAGAPPPSAGTDSEGDCGWTVERREQFTEAIIGRLAEFAPGVRDTLVAAELLVPPDIERRYGIPGGHIHHGEHALDQWLIRPTPQCSRHATPIGGLYLCGSGAFPGGGITCGPGALCAQAILSGGGGGH